MDEVFPGQQLHSPDPVQKAKDKMLVEQFNKVIMPSLRIIFGWKKGQGPGERSKHWSECLENLITFEKELILRGEAFFSSGKQPAYLDYMIWPWMERINVYDKLFQVCS